MVSNGYVRLWVKRAVYWMMIHSLFHFQGCHKYEGILLYFYEVNVTQLLFITYYLFQSVGIISQNSCQPSVRYRFSEMNSQTCKVKWLSLIHRRKQDVSQSRLSENWILRIYEILQNILQHCSGYEKRSFQTF